MPDQPRVMAGDTPEERGLWNAFFAAPARPLTQLRPEWKSKPRRKGDGKTPVNPELLAALQSIAFSALLIEYRMRRACEVIGVTLREDVSCRGLIQGFWSFVSQEPCWNGEGLCAKPAEWDNIRPHLEKLAQLRDDIVHVKWAVLLQKLGTDPLETAKRFYNHVIDAMMWINIGTGYISADGDPRAYFPRLKLQSPPQQSVQPD
ncbi:MAG: hypothetical protein IT461_09405 [Planctomycetes bacterium]|nr:hypothetical protein [Planctomycetota bacterium]